MRDIQFAIPSLGRPDKVFKQTVSTLIKDDCVRVYFACRPEREADGEMSSNTTWLELDRNDLTKVLRV